MERWEKNVRALAYKNKQLAEEMKSLILQNADSRVHAVEVSDSRKILTLERDGYTWRLNSGLDPEGAAGLYAERYTVKPFYRYFIFGFSDGLAVRKLLERCDDTNLLIICEPDKEILAEALRQYDLEDLISDHRVWPCIFEMWEDICSAIFGTVGYSYIKLLEFCILPGYDVLYTEECRTFMDEVICTITYEKARVATFSTFNRNIPQNMLFHMKNMIKQRILTQAKYEMEQEGMEGVPAIIVAAGPSLDKNIKELKKAEGRAVLFVVDAALKSVIQEGIVPDFVCTADPKAPERFFETVGEREFLWCCCGWSNPFPIRTYGKKVFYYDTIFPWWDEIVQNELKDEIPMHESGGCVSAEAFQLARYLGFRTIIFVGQDLAFTGGQSHTEGIKGVLGDNEDYIKSRYLIQVEDADGNLLDTDFQMNFYRQWFEKTIRLCKEETFVIDATEGGAKIEGCAILTLEEAIARECGREIKIYDRLEKIPPAFDDAQQKRLYQKAEEMETLKDDFSRQVEKGILLGTALLEEVKTLDAGRLSAKLKEITEQNEIIENHLFVRWATMYAKENESDLWEDILAKEDMEIGEMIGRNVRLLESYQAGIPLFEEDFREAFRKS